MLRRWRPEREGARTGTGSLRKGLLYMSSATTFSITYWGVTGTLTAPLTPPEVTGKIVGAIRQLAAQGGLADLRPGPNLDETIRHRVEQLPLHVRSTYGGNTTCVEVQTPD